MRTKSLAILVARERRDSKQSQKSRQAERIRKKAAQKVARRRKIVWMWNNHVFFLLFPFPSLFIAVKQVKQKLQKQEALGKSEKL